MFDDFAKSRFASQADDLKRVARSSKGYSSADDVARSSKRASSAADDVDNARSRRRGSNNIPCASNASVGLPIIAGLNSQGEVLIASSVISDYSGYSGVVSDVGGGILIAASPCLSEAKTFVRKNPQYEVYQSRKVVPKGSRIINGRRNSQWAGRTYPTDVVEMNFKLNRADGKLTSTQKDALRKIRAKGGIKFSRRGFPDFEPFVYKGDVSKYKITLDIDEWTGTAKDFRLANREAGLKKTPKGYTWHHVEFSEDLILVDSSVHSKIGHSGGVYTNGSALEDSVMETFGEDGGE